MLSLLDFDLSKINKTMQTSQESRILVELRRVYNQVTYYDFLEATGFNDDSYSLQRFNELQESIAKLCRFDDETFSKILAVH
jgi:hypothetical protein